MTHKISNSEQLNMGAAMKASDKLKTLGCGFNITHGYKKVVPSVTTSVDARYLISCMHDEATGKLCAAYVEGCTVCPLGFIAVDQLVNIIQPLSE